MHDACMYIGMLYNIAGIDEYRSNIVNIIGYLHVNFIVIVQN